MVFLSELSNFFRDPGLWFSAGLIGIAVGLSLLQGLRLEKELIFSTLRGFVQLTAIGFALIWIFSLKQLWVVWAVLILMILLAGRIAGQRGRGIPHAQTIATFALALTAHLTLALLILGKSIEATPEFLIPLGGMIIGNSMNGAGLTMDRLRSDMELRRQEILVCLSLGASSRQAVQEILREVLKASLIPAIDTMKALGVIFLPGMMAGLIIAGKSPLIAVRYQMIVMFMLVASAALTNWMVLMLGYRQFFTPHAQLRVGGS